MLTIYTISWLYTTGGNMKAKLLNIMLQVIGAIMAHVPQVLPQSPEALEAFMQEVMRLGSFPNNDSFRRGIATELLQTTTSQVKVSKAQIVRRLQRQIGNQIAFAVIENVKAKTAQKAQEERNVTEILPNESV